MKVPYLQVCTKASERAPTVVHHAWYHTGFFVLCAPSSEDLRIPHLQEGIEQEGGAAVMQLKPWKKEGGDTTLLDLMPFLELVFRTNVPDVREVVRSYEGQDIPAAFRERMRAVQEQKRQKAGRGLFSSLKR